jgi:hypothetical protein
MNAYPNPDLKHRSKVYTKKALNVAAAQKNILGYRKFRGCVKRTSFILVYEACFQFSLWEKIFGFQENFNY